MSTTPKVPACGHSTCHQHYLDEGDPQCIYLTEAAPDLLAALEECYQWAESMGFHEPGRRQCEEAIAKAKAKEEA